MIESSGESRLVEDLVACHLSLGLLLNLVIHASGEIESVNEELELTYLREKSCRVEVNWPIPK